MRMDLFPGEPAVPAWTLERDEVWMGALSQADVAGRAPLIVVDGRSGSGKSTLATALAAALDARNVHTDDVAWHHSMFDWQDAMIDGIVRPWSRGERVSYVPPGWRSHGRAGSIDVDPGTTLVIEGVGAARAELRQWAAAAVWVQSDARSAREGGLARDVAEGRTADEAAAFWEEWMAQEIPFLERERPWLHADVVVKGAADSFAPAGSRWVWRGPLGSATG